MLVSALIPINRGRGICWWIQGRIFIVDKSAAVTYPAFAIFPCDIRQEKAFGWDHARGLRLCVCGISIPERRGEFSTDPTKQILRDPVLTACQQNECVYRFKVANTIDCLHRPYTRASCFYRVVDPRDWIGSRLCTRNNP
jgi:hypothetical protein